jgi:hypothetical protein
MKARNYKFSSNTIEGGKHSKRELIAALIKYSKIVLKKSFTQKEYDAWLGRPLCSAQIRAKFGTWRDAMEGAGLLPKRDPKEMVEIYKDCWEEGDDVPTEKRLAQHLQKIGSPYTSNVYKNYFGSLKRLAQRVRDFEIAEITEAELIEKHDPGSIQKTTSVYCLSSTRDKTKRYVGETNLPLKQRLQLHLSDKTRKNLFKWISKEREEKFHIEINLLQKSAVRGVDERKWIATLLAQGEPLLNVAFANHDKR